MKGLAESDVFALVNAVRLVWPAGPGQQAKLFEDFRIRPTDMLRMVLGVPSGWLTPDRIAYADAMHQLALGKPVSWTRKPGWQPFNPRAVATFAEGCVLDRHFLARFSISDAEWNADLFRAVDFLGRLDADKPHLQARAYLALRLFGFRAPESFFVAADSAV